MERVIFDRFVQIFLIVCYNFFLVSFVVGCYLPYGTGRIINKKKTKTWYHKIVIITLWDYLSLCAIQKWYIDDILFLLLVDIFVDSKNKLKSSCIANCLAHLRCFFFLFRFVCLVFLQFPWIFSSRFYGILDFLLVFMAFMSSKRLYFAFVRMKFNVNIAHGT